MLETTQINKIREKRLRTIPNKKQVKDNGSVNTYFHPKSNLYTKQEFELLDSIYSDGPPTSLKDTQELVQENFWPKLKKEEHKFILSKQSDFFTKAGWFALGSIVASVIWLIFFQINVHQIKTQHDTQIVFQNTPQILTDKNADKEIIKTLENKQKTEQQNDSPKTVTNTQLAVKYHTVGNGDSLWTIANKYYSNPSPDNINRIMKANNMRRVGILNIGQKLVIPE